MSPCHLVIALSASLILFWAAGRSPTLVYDDAYITYRYADQFRQGTGLVYNAGEWVLGTTAPLYALLLGLLGLIVSDLEWLGYWLGVLGWMAAATAALAFFWQAARPWAGISAALLVTVQPSILMSLGMETPLLVALMLGLTWAWLGGRRWLAILLATAAILTRPDSALWVLILGLEVWRRKRRLPWQEAAGVALLALPWLAYAWWRYGSPLPNSAAAKVGQNALMPVSGQTPFPQMFVETLLAGRSLLEATLLGASLLLAFWLILTRERRFWWLPAWLVAYLGVYTLLEVAAFPWYFVPPVTVTYLLVALALGALIDGWWQPTSDKSNAGPPRFTFHVSRLMPQLLGLTALILLVAGQWPRMQLAQAARGHRAEYRSAAHWLAENAPPEATVASIEIGVIGYLSERPIIDTMGLVTSDMTQHQVGWRETLVYALNTHQPDYAVTLPATAWDWVKQQWWFQESYTPAAEFGSVTLFRHEKQEPAYEVPLSVSYQNGLAATAVAFERQSFQPGDTLRAWLRLQVKADQERDYLITAYLVNPQSGEQIALTTMEPFNGGYAGRHWQAGDRLSLPLRLMIPGEIAPGVYRLGLLLYDPVREAYLPLDGAPVESYPEVRAGWLRLAPGSLLAQPLPGTEHPVNVGWQEGILLEAITVPDELTGEGGLPLGLRWRATQVPAQDLIVFVHLVDESGQIVAQWDERPLAVRFPTPAWLPGDVIPHLVTLPISPPPGSYGLRIGLYNDAGERLPLEEAGEDHLWLPQALEVTSTGQVRFQSGDIGRQ